jgi:hypothetical protein
MMNDRNLETIEQVRQIMEGSEALEFKALSVGEKYNWIEEVLIRFKYHRLKRAEKGVIWRYIAKDYGLFPIAGVTAKETSSIRISTSIAPVSSLCLLLTPKARPGRLIPMRR